MWERSSAEIIPTGLCKYRHGRETAASDPGTGNMDGAGVIPAGHSLLDLAGDPVLFRRPARKAEVFPVVNGRTVHKGKNWPAPDPADDSFRRDVRNIGGSGGFHHSAACGATVYAAVRAPRRPISSCTEKTKVMSYGRGCRRSSISNRQPARLSSARPLSMPWRASKNGAKVI